MGIVRALYMHWQSSPTALMSQPWLTFISILPPRRHSNGFSVWSALLTGKTKRGVDTEGWCGVRKSSLPTRTRSRSSLARAPLDLLLAGDVERLALRRDVNGSFPRRGRNCMAVSASRCQILTSISFVSGAALHNFDAADRCLVALTKYRRTLVGCSVCLAVARRTISSS
jgi:hypothetical protein